MEKKKKIIPPFLDNALGFNIARTDMLFRRELSRVLRKYNITPEQWALI
ncbi:MAG: hypothetical protein JW864_09320 [Spirochaetes bacterium]|nr:hypothetical protein [Spirochaetota bacterium]